MLALQGAFALHQQALERLRVANLAVRRPRHLDECDALIVPGGESTTMSKLLDSSGLFEAISVRLDAAMPVLGTCAGAILLASTVFDGRADQRCFGAIDIGVRRNGYGRQIDSFETDIDLGPHADAPDVPFHAVFIRAPIIESVGPDVETIATVGDRPVLCEAGTVSVATFHPELGGDDRLHKRFIERHLS